MLALLRPKPFRGDQVAAGTVVLSVLVLLLNVRFAGEWSSGVHLVYTALAAALVLGMSVAAPREPAGPPAWHSTLYVAGFLLAATTLVDLADVLGSGGGAGTYTWVGLALTALAAWMSRVRGSASGTLLAAVSAVVTSLALLEWLSSPDGVTPFRYLLLADTLVLALMALWQRIRGPAHGVQLLNAVGLSLLAIGLTFALSAFGLAVGFFFGGPGTPPAVHIAWGWTLLMLTGGIGILSAGAADNERGNVLVGIALLVAFVAMAAEGNLLGWPILLGGAAIALLVIGLRPSTPLPAEPPDGAGSASPPPPLPVRPVS
ncbi:MAG: hypothetical protein JWO02_2980 [Solirubrobacterales bacterium]|nr:hypothetical protein [Solirubrobacterales bacterium]